MNFRAGHVVTDGRLYYKVLGVGKRNIKCSRNLRQYNFSADQLTIVACNRAHMPWDDFEIETVGSNLHMSNKELAEKLHRSEGAIRVYKEKNNLKKSA